jgi:squalene monooxygenase
MPDKIIGELLQPGGVESLRKLGLRDCLENIDSPAILGYAVFPPGEEPVALPYPKQEGVRPRGQSFHHGRLIQNLRKRAKESCEVREATVTGLIEDQKGKVIGVKWKKSRKEKGEAYADYVFVCDGLLSNLRDQFTSTEINSTSKFVGMVMENSAQKLPYANHGHVFLIDPTPTLIYPISNSGDVRVLVDIPNDVYPKSKEDMRKYLQEVTAPQLTEPLKSMFLETVEKEVAFRSMPCGILHSEPLYRPGAMMLGK